MANPACVPNIYGAIINRDFIIFTTMLNKYVFSLHVYVKYTIFGAWERNFSEMFSIPTTKALKRKVKLLLATQASGKIIQ